ncbi:3-isopropylmalate dehydratase small subunit [Fictibacillus aquaticus]|uniref:3-isopropylmalate dehydratase small subunit n=1 Tax=Fictibacillus aquaticus TaxID=2021314 RepID=A0A235F9U9_9BACL|nr:3-isopropylmalate dehydratase small subunit [Fictibacillus aquaticus]OYD58096.1 3-isopropylmalate dehydratase small subunit [Fictibacillus aquaticus]
MRHYKSIQAKCAVLKRDNIDTDQIIPKQFLKRIEKTGFGDYLFNDWRYLDDGAENPDFELNKTHAKGAEILIAGANFGCGSSREHAPWALKDYGFKAVIAPSFADIFYNNCLKNGIVAVSLDETVISGWIRQYEKQVVEIDVDLEKQVISGPDGKKQSFEFDPFWKEMIMNGWDEISYTLQSESSITQYEDEKEVDKLGIRS